jgi:hypothetical protein
LRVDAIDADVVQLSRFVVDRVERAGQDHVDLHAQSLRHPGEPISVTPMRGGSSTIGRGHRRAGLVVLVAALFVAGCGGSPVADQSAPPIAAAAMASEPSVAVAPDGVEPEVAAPVPTTTPAALSAAAPTSVPAPPTTVVALPFAPRGSLESLVDEPRAAAALALIDFPWRRVLPGWSIAFLPDRPGLRGLTIVDDRRVEIYVRDNDTPASLARIIAHELGHAVDVELNSPSDRDRWRAARGVRPEVHWWPANAESDFDTLAGDFAEAMATLLTGSVSQSRVAPPPGPSELALLADLARGR